MSHFTVYVDREPKSQVNVSQAVMAPGLRTAPVGKRFVSNGIPELQSARKALGDVKNQYGGHSAQRGPSLKPGMKASQQMPIEETLKPTALTASVLQAHSQQVTCREQCAPELAQQSSETKELDWGPKEHMIAYNWEEEDNFEDLWPLEDRPTTYLQNILNCRPPMFSFGKENGNETKSDDSFDLSGYCRPRENIEFEEIEREEIDDLSFLNLDISGLSETG